MALGVGTKNPRFFPNLLENNNSLKILYRRYIVGLQNDTRQKRIITIPKWFTYIFLLISSS